MYEDPNKLTLKLTSVDHSSPTFQGIIQDTLKNYSIDSIQIMDGGNVEYTKYRVLYPTIKYHLSNNQLLSTDLGLTYSKGMMAESKPVSLPSNKNKNQ